MVHLPVTIEHPLCIDEFLLESRSSGFQCHVSVYWKVLFYAGRQAMPFHFVRWLFTYYLPRSFTARFENWMTLTSLGNLDEGVFAASGDGDIGVDNIDPKVQHRNIDQKFSQCNSNSGPAKTRSKSGEKYSIHIY